MSKPLKVSRIANDESDGVASVEAYYQALGRFVHTFAKVELAVFFVLRHYARIPMDAARALLSGIRADQTQGMLRRLQEVGLIDRAKWEDVDRVLKQFSEINKFRNDLLHDTTILSETGRGVVSNIGKALHEGKFEQSMVSPGILDNATSDLRKITLYLNVKHTGRRDPGGLRIAAYLREPWLYKRQSSPPDEYLLRESSRRAETITRKSPPKPRLG
jgi:hypothetical protein